jgi:hypothetical protein
MVEEIASVKFAATDCCGLILVPSWFQVNVIGPFALVGVQLVVPMLKASERPLLVFLT